MYVVYWSQGYVEDWSVLTDKSTFAYEPQSKEFPITELNEALKFCEELRSRRKQGSPVRHITYVCEHPDQVGESGVASIVDGKTPDGQIYDWKKRRI